MKEFSVLEKAIGYEFQRGKWVNEALTHSSYANEKKKQHLKHNERLEFLGDSVLSIAVSTAIFENYPSLPEGDLTRIRAAVVCEPALAQAARHIRLGEFLHMGKGEEQSGGRTRDSILADAFEAMIAAIYLDSDLEAVSKWILNLLGGMIEDAISGKVFRDYKTALQEIAQQKGHLTPEYEVVGESGPDHAKVFRVTVTLGRRTFRGSGRSKKEAEQDAAQKALTMFNL